MRKLSLLVLFVPYIAMANSDRWVKYGEADDGGLGFVDTKTAVENKDGSWILWTKDTKTKCSESDNKNQCYIVSKNQINCVDSSNEILEIYLYKTSDGSLLESHRDLSIVRTIVPDTLGEKLYNATCVK